MCVCVCTVHVHKNTEIKADKKECICVQIHCNNSCYILFVIKHLCSDTMFSFSALPVNETRGKKRETENENEKEKKPLTINKRRNVKRIN